MSQHAASVIRRPLTSHGVFVRYVLYKVQHTCFTYSKVDLAVACSRFQKAAEAIENVKKKKKNFGENF